LQQIRVGARSIDLSPQPAHLRHAQHDLAREANIVSISHGAEPNRFVRYYIEKRLL